MMHCQRPFQTLVLMQLDVDNWLIVVVIGNAVTSLRNNCFGHQQHDNNIDFSLPRGMTTVRVQ